MKFLAFAFCAFLFQLLLASPTFAATQTMTANIGFDTSLTITKGNDINLGSVKATQAGTYVIAPNGGVTASNGGVYLGGGTQAGSLTIAGSSTQTVDISANNYVANAGVTPSAATCAYNTGAAVPCSLASQTAPGVGKPLLIGVTVAVDGTQNVGTSAAPSFDIVVNYH